VIRSVNDAWPKDFSPPCVLKPVRQGSSVGLRFIDRVDDFGAAVKDSLRYDTELLLEERIVGRETTVGILKDVALPIVEVRPKAGTYDYQNKYTAGATEYFCPAPFEAATTKRIQEAGLAAFRAVGGRDYARVDVMVGPREEAVVLEVNTLPGMTETSLFPKAAAAAGLSYADLCQTMIEMALTHSK
jgi:D-alanine-D-alanine ligase